MSLVGNVDGAGSSSSEADDSDASRRGGMIRTSQKVLSKVAISMTS